MKTRPKVEHVRLTVTETKLLIELLDATYERGIFLHPGDSFFGKKMKYMEQHDLCEEDPSCPGHWHITSRGIDYFWPEGSVKKS